MGEPDLRARIKEMLVKNLMLQVTPEQIGDDLPLFGANGLGLDSIDALFRLALVVSMKKENIWSRRAQHRRWPAKRVDLIETESRWHRTVEGHLRSVPE